VDGVKVVWARTADIVKPTTVAESDVWRLWSRAPIVVRPLPFLGGKYGKEGTTDAPEPASGVALMPADSDHVVRSYLRTFEAERGKGSPAIVDSLPWAITKQYAYWLDPPEAHPAQDQPAKKVGGEPKKRDPKEWAERIKEEAKEQEPDKHARIFNFSYDTGRFRQIGFGDFLNQNRTGLWPKDHSPLEGRIVILGGKYSLARDKHFTPVGERFGLEMVAEAVDGEVERRLIGHLAIWIAAGLDFLAGLALVLVHWRLHKPWAVYAMATFIFVLSVVCSLIAFRSAAYWFNFTAVLVGVWIHLLWEGAQEGRRARSQLAAQHAAGHS
jgi:CHASE2 domain-containing sensor protein